MSYGGLRGAVGFSLVTILDEDNPFKDIFLTTTLFIIFFTVFLQGSTIKFVVSKLKIQTKSTEASKIVLGQMETAKNKPKIDFGPYGNGQRLFWVKLKQPNICLKFFWVKWKQPTI